MKLNNKKIDMLLKLTMYFLPFIVLFITALGTEAPSWDEGVFFTLFNEQMEGITNNALYSPFITFLQNNLLSGSVFENIVLTYMFYALSVEIIILFKNALIWIVRFANNLLERGFNE